MRSKLLLLAALLSVFCSPIRAGDFQRPTSVHLDREGERWAAKTLKKLSLEEKIGQMFMVRVMGQFTDLRSPDYLRLRDQMERYHLGSVLLTLPSDGPFSCNTGPYEAESLL